MTVPEILLALRPLLAVLAVLFLLPRLFGRPFREFTGFLHDLRSLLRAAEESKKLGPTERSIPDVTKLFLPAINRDFPAFNWPEERVAIEKRIVSVLAARQALDLSKLSAPSESLRERVRLAIEDDRMNELTRSFSDIVIHKTAIADYKNQPTLTEIRLVSSIGFTASLSGESVRKSEGKARAAALAAPHRVETSVTSVLVHAQSVNVKSGYQKIVGTAALRCRAPTRASALSVRAHLCRPTVWYGRSRKSNFKPWSEVERNKTNGESKRKKTAAENCGGLFSFYCL